MNFFPHIFQEFQLDFKLGIIYCAFSNESFHGRVFHVSMGVVCFSDGGASFLRGRNRGHQFWWGAGGRGFKKICKMWGMPPIPSPHDGKPCVLILNFCFGCYALFCCACSLYVYSVLRTLLMLENVSYVSNKCHQRITDCEDNNL